MKRIDKKMGFLTYPEVREKATETTRYWPFIFCINEDKAIAIRKIPMRMAIDKHGFPIPTEKATINHWNGDECEWLEDRYKIFFEMYEEMAKTGKTKVLCPVCGGPVDFRLFPSIDKPELVR